MLGVARLFGTSARDALYGISYANAVLYSRAMPMVGDADDDSPVFDESKDASVAGAFDLSDTEIIRA